MLGFFQDVTYALRLFARYRGFSVLAIAMLALGIGVTTAVGPIHAAGLRDPGAPQIYLPYHRNAIYDMALAIRTSGDPRLIAAAARDRIEGLGGKRPVYMVRQMSEYVAAAARHDVIGLLVGTVSGLALARSLRSLLFAVSPADAITLLGVARSLTAVTMIACYLPARPAVRASAWDALRSD